MLNAELPIRISTKKKSNDYVNKYVENTFEVLIVFSSPKAVDKQYARNKFDVMDNVIQPKNGVLGKSAIIETL